MTVEKNNKNIEEKTKVVKPEAKYPIMTLEANCRQLFGVSSCTFVGATYGMTGEYTVEEIKTHIKKWCGKGVV